MSKRTSRVNQLIKRELGQLLLREIDFPKDVLVTVTRVEVSVNLNQAKVYVSVIPENQGDKVFEILGRQIYDLQQKINRRLNMRPIPKIKFVKENETVKAGKIEELLAKLKKEEK